MTPATPTPHDLLRAAVARSAGRPLVTWYDLGTGERVELSATTFDNWVAKTAGMLQDGLGAGPGDRVALLLPPHWQALAWAAACWATGCTVVLGEAPASVAVCGPASLPAVAGTGAAETVVVSLRPMGRPFAGRLPRGAVDYAVEIPGYPDRFVPPPGSHPADPGVEEEGRAHTRSGLTLLARDRAGHLGLDAGARLLRAADRLDRLDLGVLLDALLVPLALGGSAVLVVGDDEETLARIVTAERVSLSVPC